MRIIWLYTWQLQKAHGLAWLLLILFFLILTFVVQWAESLVPPPLDVAALATHMAQNSLLFIVLGVFVFLFAAGSLVRGALASGMLEQFALAGHPPFLVVGAAIFVQWVAIGIPLGLLITLHNFLMHDPSLPLGILLPTTLLIFLNASSWGAAFGSLTPQGGQNSTYLLALLLLPLILPSLLFGAGALMATFPDASAPLWDKAGLTPLGEALGFLLALSCLNLPMGAFVGGAICRQHMEI